MELNPLLIRPEVNVRTGWGWHHEEIVAGFQVGKEKLILEEEFEAEVIHGNLFLCRD